jgi:integrase
MTAQRYSDYSRIGQSHIHIDELGSKTIRIRQKKTTTNVIIPMSGVVERILSKYENRLPKSYDTKLNAAIKIICKELEIDDKIDVIQIRGGKEATMMVQKYDLISSHTARRTGCTLMYKNEIPTIDIMKISGHKTESELLKYIRVTKEETAQRLSLNPFFNSSLKVV